MKSRRLISAAVCALLIAYPLSLGPVLRIQIDRKNLLVRNFHTGRIWFPGFYDPLAWLCDHVPLIQSAMSWYLDLWVGDYPLDQTVIVQNDPRAHHTERQRDATAPRSMLYCFGRPLRLCSANL